MSIKCKQEHGEPMYRQCLLQKKEGVATISRIIWGDEGELTKGRTVKVKEDNGIWTEGWQVMSVSKESLPERYVIHRSHDHTRQRASSDI
jgi:hypothetical protein